MTQRYYHRPMTCIVCHERMERAPTGRPRLTCSDACRQTKRRRTTRSEFQIKRERAARRIAQWEKRLGMDFSRIPAYHFEPDGMSLRDRLLIYLPRGMEVRECWTCHRPYLPDGRTSPTCSEACLRIRRDYFRRLRENFYNNPRPMPREIYPYIRQEKRLSLCAHCGTPFIPQGRRKYCNDKCKEAAYWKRRPLRVCKVCGGQYRGHEKACSKRCGWRLYRATVQRCSRCKHVVQEGREVLPTEDTRLPDARGKAVVFCSGRCRDAMGWLPMRKVCEECKQGYYPTQRSWQTHQKFCSTACSRVAHERIRRERTRAAAAAIIRTCQHCGDVLPAERQKHRTCAYKYCSDACMAEHRKLGKERPIAVPREVFERGIVSSREYVLVRDSS